MIFGFLKGKKKSGPKLRAKQEVEIEFQSGEGAWEAHFTVVLQVQRKRITLRAPGTERRPIRMSPGQQVTVTTLEDNTLYWFPASVLDAGEREFDITPPGESDSQDLPPRNDGYRVEVPIPVEFRAMNTAHTQVAQTYAITPGSLILTTNLPIPPGTMLHLELEIPSAPDISTKGRAVGSERHPVDKRKHLSEIEFEDISDEDRETILRYAVYYRRRQERKRERGEDEP